MVHRSLSFAVPGRAEGTGDQVAVLPICWADGGTQPDDLPGYPLQHGFLLMIFLSCEKAFFRGFRQV